MRILRSPFARRTPAPVMRPTRWLSVLAFAGLAAVAGCADPTGLRLGEESQSATFLSDALPTMPPLHSLFTGPREDPAPAIDRYGVRLRAAVVPVDTALAAPPMGLRIEVTAANESDGPVSLPVRGCTVWPEVHGDPGRDGEPLWVPSGECMQQPHTVSLEPGEEHTFSFLAHDAMLAGALEDGRYYFTARFRHADETLPLEAGSADVRLRVPDLAFHVQVDDPREGVRARLRVENRNPTPVHLEWGHCALGFELYRDPDLTDDPARLEEQRSCLDYLAIAVVEPGSSLEAEEFDYTAPGRSGRNPDLQPGEYHLVVTARLNWRTYRFPMGTITVR